MKMTMGLSPDKLVEPLLFLVEIGPIEGLNQGKR